MLMIYARLIGGLAVVIALLALGYHFGEMPYKTKYEALQAADWETKAKGEQAAKVVIAGQLVDLQKQIKVNADVRDNLAKQNESIVADRDATLTRVRRLEQLLSAAAARPSARGGAVSKADDRPGATGASGDPGPTEVERLLIDARDEAKRNAARLNALVAEVTPQVTPQ
jgi:hypothetical protein